MKKFPSKNKMAAPPANIRNPYMIAKMTTDKIFIAWSPQEKGRAYRSARYSVIHVGFKTDPKSHWQDYGNKTFCVFTTRESAAQQAIEWANKRYGKREWVRDPFGSYQDVRAIDAVKDALKQPEADNA